MSKAAIHRGRVPIFKNTGSPFIPPALHYHAGNNERSRPNLMLTASPPGTHPITSEISQEHIARPTRAHITLGLGSPG